MNAEKKKNKKKQSVCICVYLRLIRSVVSC
jgi:hypothetical protein